MESGISRSWRFQQPRNRYRWRRPEFCYADYAWPYIHPGPWRWSMPPHRWSMPAPRPAGTAPVLHPAGGGAALFFQRGKGVEVPEEAGYPDQELLEQDIDFLGILPEVTEIRVDIVNLVDCHASLNSASNRLRLVLGEVMTCFVADQEKNVLQAFVGGRGAERCITSIYLLDITQELSGDEL